MINLEFFKWLKDEYGMQLDIYAWDAGNLDGKGVYGSIDSERFKRHYPNGVDTVYEKARSFGCRLGVWCGPDGFGNSPEEEQDRIEMMVKLCRDHDFMLFKMDSVCGQLRTEKQDAFVRMMEECRRYSPDLILLNHRLNLGKGLPYATTFLWEGAETYIDVHMLNRQTATHHRVDQTFVGAGSLMSMHRYLDQQVPLDSKIHNSLRRPNLPILVDINHLMKSFQPS